MQAGNRIVSLVVLEPCPKCGFEQQPTTECRRCGLVFEKWREREVRLADLGLGAGPPIEDLPPKDSMPADWPIRSPSRVRDDDDNRTEASTGSLIRRIGRRFTFVPERVSTLRLAGHAAVWLVGVLWGGWFILQPMATNRIGSSFMHRVNLVFHEAGHILFAPFGDFMAVLGGSAMQLLIPLVVALAFLVQNRDPFGASVGVWWLGQSAKDLAPYINDARLQALPLLGGVTGRDVPGYHDWHNLLSRTGLLAWDTAIARAVDLAGTLLLVAAISWGGFILWREYRRHDPELYAGD